MAADITNSYLVEKAADYAILSELAYETWHDYGTGWVPDKKAEKWQELYNKGYRVVDFCPNDSTTGFSATLFQKDSKNILAIRGTTLTDLLDLAADAELATFQMPSGQFESMVQWITTKNLSSFDVTGHSLGGFLAQAAKATFSDRVQDVYTYNAPGAKSVLPLYTLVSPVPFSDYVIVTSPIIDLATKMPRTFLWRQSTWEKYQTFLTNKDVVNDKIYNVSGAHFISPISGTHTDIGPEVFIANSSHGIASMITDFKKNLYYLDPRKPVSFIGSKADEKITGNYNSGHYNNETIKNLTIEGGYGDDIIWGSDGNDLLYGDLDPAITGEAALKATGNFGGVAGNDQLIGGKGNDTLIGGAGNDIYFINHGDGNDTIIDKEGNNTIVYKGADGNERRLYNFYSAGNGTNAYISPDGKIHMTENTITFEGGFSIALADFIDGDFGINLIDGPNNSYTAAQIIGTDGNDIINASNSQPNGYRKIQGLAGNDIIYATSYGGEIEGGPGSDTIAGAPNSDKLFGESYGEMQDLVQAGETASDEGSNGDFIEGFAGDDYIYGSNKRDMLYGGAGNDLIVGGGGNDAILSDFDSIVNVYNPGSSTFIGNDVVYAGAGDDDVRVGGGDDEIYGGAGSDTLMGEGGNDIVYGGDGNDILDGDVWAPLYVPAMGSFPPAMWTPPAYVPGNDFLNGGAGNDQITGGGGTDVLYGESGNDTIYGDANMQSIYSAPGVPDYIPPAGNPGDDLIDGGDGNDTLVGGGDDDQIFGEFAGEMEDFIAERMAA